MRAIITFAELEGFLIDDILENIGGERFFDLVAFWVVLVLFCEFFHELQWK